MNSTQFLSISLPVGFASATAFGLIAVGAFGLSWSLLGSLAPVLFAKVVKRRPLQAASSRESLTFEVLVTAHNEAEVIERTLESVSVSISSFVQSEHFGSRLQTKVTVGLDHCTDGTALKVEQFSARHPSLEIATVPNFGSAGKWTMLALLAEQSQATWIAFVDCGSIWHRDLVREVSRHWSDDAVLAVAPSYLPERGLAGGGALERANWKLEQLLKSLENHAGGPTSVHGATVFYRKETLLTVLKTLKNRTWLNDDVVIPLSLRLRFPTHRIVYLAARTSEQGAGAVDGWVTDVGVRSELGLEIRRRRRLVLGNLQWVDGIYLADFFQSFVRSPYAMAVASRRIFRLFWAYWVLFLGLGIGMTVALLAPAFRNDGTGIIVGIFLSSTLFAFVYRSNWMRRLLMAFLSGLDCPRLWLSLKNEKEISWN
ncbi:MAG: glycosyltransferase [Methylotenera sp.]|nr:glycosyltransferase [Oligoflexia bacterium]